MPEWIHERARHILAKNSDMPKSEAFAIATQQAHSIGKSPKGYGTEEGRSTAKAKYDTPKDDKKMANPGHLSTPKLKEAGINTEACLDELMKIAEEKDSGWIQAIGDAMGKINMGGNLTGGTSGKGPSAGFQAFQKAREAALAKKPMQSAPPRA